MKWDVRILEPVGFFAWVVYLWESYWELFLIGARNTVIIAVSGTVLGLMLGMLVGIGRSVQAELGASKFKRGAVKLLHGALGAYIEVFRGTPMIVQAMVICYGFMYGFVNPTFGIKVPFMAMAIFVVSINTGAYMAEIIRGGIISVDHGQTEAAHAIGLTHWQAMTSIVLPQAIRNIMPSIGNELIVNIKDSSVLNVIAVSELYFQGKSAAGAHGRYFEVYFIIAVIYLVLTLSTSRLLRLIEKKMDGPKNFMVLGSQTDSSALQLQQRTEGGE